MRNINKQALREAAQEATGAHARLSVMPAGDIFDISQHEGTQLDADITALNAFNEAANPATVLALLDEMEAAEKRNAELEGIVFSVKLPVAPLQHETLKLCLETSDGYGMQKGAEYMRDEIIKVLHAAGIGVKGGGLR